MKKNTKTICSFITVLFAVYVVLSISNNLKDRLCSSNINSDTAFHSVIKVSNGQHQHQNNVSHIEKHADESIPKIIHQIWNDEILPTEFVKNVQGLARDNPSPEWKYYFWTKDTGLAFIKDNFPSLLEKATRMTNLMRSDILRYLVIYKYGGVYFDLDTVSVKPLKSFVETHTCSLALEPAENYFYYSVTTDFILSNSAVLCMLNHSFFAHVIQHIEKLPDNCKEAVSCTGPSVFSKLYRDLNKTNNNSWLPDVQPSEVFQDVYDDRVLRKKLDYNCYKNKNLIPFHVKMCANWIARGKEKRSLSERALTYHTWFHTGGKKIHLDKSNNIKNIVPNVLFYGKDFK